MGTDESPTSTPEQAAGRALAEILALVFLSRLHERGLQRSRGRAMPGPRRRRGWR